MHKRPHILITNDDGIEALGLKHLWEALNPMAEITVVAPAQEQSSVGMCITLRKPLQLKKTHWVQPQVWCVTGTPADCVKLALTIVLETKPDLIISGINAGSNAGRNIFYSGTVAAAIEGVMHNIPSLALSCYDSNDPDFLNAAKHTPLIVEQALNHPLPLGTFLNVNFPKKHLAIKGLKMTCQGQGFWMEDPKEHTHSMPGESYYWLGAKAALFNEHEDSDITWLEKGYITVAPVHVGNLTDYEHLAKSKLHFEKHF